MDEKAAVEAVQEEERQVVQKKLDEIRAMPDWKRKLFLDKNPQYKEMLE